MEARKKRKKKWKGAPWAGELKEAKEMVPRSGLDLPKAGVGQAPLQMSSNHHPRANASSVASLKTHLNPSVTKAGMFPKRRGNGHRCTQLWSCVVPPIFSESPWSSHT